jgi:hypothetical protein
MDRGGALVAFVGSRMSADARAKPKADEDQAGGFRLLGAGARNELSTVRIPAIPLPTTTNAVVANG